MAKYLKSATGAILPYSVMLANCDGVKEMTPAECTAHEESVNPTKKKKKAKKAKAKVKATPVAAKEVVVTDFEDGEPAVEEVLQALEVD